MILKSRERKLVKLLERENLSASHDFDHLKRVSEFCVGLGKIYKADRDILVASALTHDLGRMDKKHRGRQSAVLGGRLAKPLLKKAGYKPNEVKLIVQVISEHDDPKFRSKLLESRILKEADFLDGFGARGILRSVMYAGETGGGVKEVMRRMKKTMRERLKNLEFKESKRLAFRKYRLNELFLDDLRKSEKVSEASYAGKLIVIEGISGCGKDTQVEMLSKYLKDKGVEVKTVNHPTKFLKSLWRQWRVKVDDRMSEAFLMMADRVRMTRDEILPELKKGKVVISSRSSISAQVYQKDKWSSDEFYRLGFRFEPMADRVIFLDISAKEALKRTDSRIKKGKEKDRGFFGFKQEEQIKRFGKILKNYPNVVKVDASGSREKIFEKVKDSLKDLEI